MSHKASEKWEAGVMGMPWKALYGRLVEHPGNDITFASVRMDDDSLSVRTALYTCSCSRTVFRCFLDTMLNATAMPCNKESLNPMPQFGVSQTHAMFPHEQDIHRGRGRKRRGKKWQGDLVLHV